MKKLLFILGLFLLVCVGLFLFNNNKSSLSTTITKQTFNAEFSNYFRHKDIKKATEIVVYIDKNRTSPAIQKAQPAIMGFVIGILKDNPDIIASWSKLNFSPNMKQFIKTAKLNSEQMEKIVESDNPDINNLDAYDLDCLWGYYAATGDINAVEKIIIVKNQSNDALLRTTAEWSLDANSKTYPEVQELLSKNY